MNAMGQVATLSDKLAMMPDNMLPRLAQQYKTDAITLSLILGEKNRRDRVRNTMKAEAGGQPQPKVNDQIVSEMQLPEQQGIGMLPAQNIAHMADGGIAGYADGELIASNEPVVRMADGGVARYAGEGESLVRTTTGGKSWFLDVPDTIRDPNVPWYRQIPNPAAQGLAGVEFPTREAAIAAYNRANAVPVGTRPATASQMGDYGPSMYAPESKTGATTKATTTGKGGLPDLTAATAGAATAPRTLTAEQAKAQAKQFSDFGAAKEELQKATDDAETSAAKMRAALTAGLPQTPALQGLEKLLDKQEAESGGEKDKAAGLALLSAGLAIAGGSSRYALQNLKEAIPAVAQYGDALKDIKKMERENMKMRGEIEQARRAEARDDTKLKLQLEEKIADRRDKINELGIGLTSKIADTDARTATTLWTTSQEVASRERTAGAAANAQLNLFRQLGAAPEGSALQKGFQMYKQESSEPTLYANYVKMANDPLQGDAFLKKYPTFDVYKAGMTGQGQFFSDSAVNPNAVRGR